MFSSEFFCKIYLQKQNKNKKCLICYTSSEQFSIKFLRNHVATFPINFECLKLVDAFMRNAYTSCSSRSPYFTFT